MARFESRSSRAFALKTRKRCYTVKVIFCLRSQILRLKIMRNVLVLAVASFDQDCTQHDSHISANSDYQSIGHEARIGPRVERH